MIFRVRLNCYIFERETFLYIMFWIIHCPLRDIEVNLNFARLAISLSTRFFTLISNFNALRTWIYLNYSHDSNFCLPYFSLLPVILIIVVCEIFFKIVVCIRHFLSIIHVQYWFLYFYLFQNNQNNGNN